MSWALEEWKEGLPMRALQKIQELEGQLDKLKKEKQQRQFQLDSLEAALQKQKQKVENEKIEGTSLKRENQRLMEICENLEKVKQKISHELQVKESQVNFQEGQLNSGKKQIEKLEQELKRYKSELERSQQAAQSVDVSLNPCSTPQKLPTTPLTPSQYCPGSKYEDLKEKYTKEVEERKRLEAEVKTLKAKKISQADRQATINHRDIARHQASSSVFSWQEEKTPSCFLSSSQKTPVRRDASTSHFSGEEVVTPKMPVLPVGKSDHSSSFCDNSGSSHVLDQFKAQNQELKSKISELELHLQGQEKEMKSQVNKFQELQLQLEKTKVELIEKEKVLNKSRDELVRTTAQYDQEAAKCMALEQKLKKLSEDLSCQRQNAESARCSLEQKIKEKEKELQEELSRQHHSFQALDQEYTQVKVRLTQELQQAKNTLSVLQVELDKITSVKQQLEKNFEEFKQKFSRNEQALHASQIMENELRRSIEEVKKENSLLRSHSEERAKEVCRLEEELGKAKLCLSQSQEFAEEMRAKNTSQETMLRDLKEKINQQENSLTLEKLRLALVDLEQQRDCSQDLLKKREHHIEQLNDKLSKIEKECKALLDTLELNKKEYEDMKEEKNEKEKLINQVESEKEILQSKINHLETCLKTQQIKCHEYNERVRTLEMERENLNVEIRNLHNVIDSKLVEVETQKQAYLELQQKAEFSDQKHQKEIENMCVKTSQLTGQIEGLEQKLQLMSSEIIAKDQLYQELHADYENLQDLLRFRDASLVTNEDHQKKSLAFEQWPAMNNSFSNTIAEQGSISLERNECHVDAYQSPNNSAISQHREASSEFSLESEKQINSGLQKLGEQLVQIREENFLKAEQIHQSFVSETSPNISKLQEESPVHQNVVAETLISLENKEKELEFLKEKLQAKQTEIQELKKNSYLLEDTLKELQFLTETLGAEKKEMSSIISLSKKEIEELTQENGVLREINETLKQEKMNLLQKNEELSNCVEEQEKSISQLSDQYKQERFVLFQQCEETRSALEALSEQYKAAEEKSTALECVLSERTSVCESRTAELEQLKEVFAQEQQESSTKLASSKEQNEKLALELELVQHTLRSEITDMKNTSKSEVESLKQEIRTLKEEKIAMQKEVNDFLQENERLIELTKSKQKYLELDPDRDSMKEPENEIEKCIYQHQMDLDIKDTSPHRYKAHLVQLEALIRFMELKLEESEKEKESLQQKLQTDKGELGTSNLQDSQSQENSDLKDCEIDVAEQYISVLHELSSSQKDNVQLHCSLQTAMNKLNELEKMCEVLKVEKLELESELNDSRSECITATSKMAEEVEKLVKEMKVLNDENGVLQSELVKEMSDGKFGGQQNKQQNDDASVSLNPLDNSSFSEQMNLSNKEVEMQFAQLQERFSCLQSEHKILHDQYCQVSSKMSELRSYVDTLKAENSALSVSLRNLEGDLVKERKHGPEEEHLSLSFSCVTDSPSLTNYRESFCKDVSDHTGDISLLSNLEGNVSANPCNVDEVSYSSLEEENLTEKEMPSASVRTVEELEILCQVYLQSLESLREKIESQEIMKNKEIQELEQLLSSERIELDCLRKQYLSENEQWQQKLTSVTLEMESKLEAEKKQTKHLSLELEVARLQLQGLDLSSRSLLGTDMEDAILCQKDSCDTKDPAVCISDVPGKTHAQGTDQICGEDVQQNLGLETGIIKLERGRFTRERCSEQSVESNCETPVEDKTQDCSDLFSVPNPMEVLDNQVQSLQLQEEASGENLKLLQAIEDWDKKIESLLNEIKEVDSKLSVREIQLKTKIETFIQLEKIVKELKKDKSDFSEKLESFSCNQELGQIESSEGLCSKLEMGADESLNEVVEGTIANMENNWKERFLEVENELTRVKSEKARLEQCSFSLEADLEVVQAEKLCLEKDNENKQEIIVHLEEELSVVSGERNRLHGELDTVSEENKALGQMSEKMKEKIQELESHQRESVYHIEMVEAEVKDKTELIQTLSSEVSELTRERTHLQEQLQALQKDTQALSLAVGELESQIGQLNKEKESLARESKNLQDKLSESEHEKLSISKALEVALMEKGEFAGRLGSTQEEVHQLRKGIEKLSVRIEADEKKQLLVVEKLKESQRENDSLRDKVENLERELQMSEENQELVILDAENSKAEVETLKAQVDEMAESRRAFELDLVAVRSDKADLTRQLQEQQGKVSELDALVTSLRSLLEDKDRARAQMEEEAKAAVQTLHTQLQELSEEVAALWRDDSTCEDPGADLSGEAVCQLRCSIEKLKVHIQANGKKQLRIVEQLKDSQHRADLLKDRIEKLERELELSQKNQELMVLEAENSKTEVETLKAEIQGMAQNLRDLELEFINTRSENENLTKKLQKEHERVSELEVRSSSVENLLQEKEQEKVQIKKESEVAVEMLQTQLKELNERMVTLCNDQETHKTTEQNLNSQVCSLELEKAQLLQDLDEAKSNYHNLQSSMEGLIQEVEDSKQKLEKTTEKFCRLEGQLKDQKQLISQLAQLEGEQQLWQKEKLELRNLTKELEQKVQVLQFKNGTLQGAFEELQKSCNDLESELELMRMEKTSLVERVNTMVTEEAKLQKEMEEMVQKTTELKEEFITEKNRLTEESQVLVEELKSAKRDHFKYVNQLEKQFERAQGKIKLLLKSCKQMEGENKMLQKEISQLEAAQKQKSDSLVDNNVDKLMTEIKELKETLEEKTKEADEYLDKYCSLLISHDKLEKAKEMLETQVTHLHSQQSKRDLQSPLLNSAAPGPFTTPSVGEKLSSGRNKASGKRQRSTGMWEKGGAPTPPTPETFSKKSRKAIKTAVLCADNEEDIEFEPEGLPEVVKKGFADIPTGKTSPYVLRRTTMATRTSPRLAAQKIVQSSLTQGKENVAESSKPTAGGSRSHKAKAAQPSPADSGIVFPELPVKSLTTNNVPDRSSAESPREGLRTKRECLTAPSPDTRPDAKSSENCRVQ
uniref:centromere protein F isoform X2 n=1 Tax=Jaculus jaculus TaxID=51337 RepID=UPI001E1B0DD0|nr:centromere protein F isoform X2 [Jaculus jaculus]